MGRRWNGIRSGGGRHTHELRRDDRARPAIDGEDEIVQGETGNGRPFESIALTSTWTTSTEDVNGLGACGGAVLCSATISPRPTERRTTLTSGYYPEFETIQMIEPF